MEIIGTVKYRERHPLLDKSKNVGEGVSCKFNVSVTSGNGPLVDGQRLKTLSILVGLEDKAQKYANMDVRVIIDENNYVIAMEYYAP
ncbi:MAG: hypothetical protein GC137_02145 [Alphaproteobacteria bacterium]|nr:hypothetical protein [Alphaproteobacteria bacterium]